MKNMSFGMTIRSFKDGTKTVTRRLGWTGLQTGDRVMAVEKAMGLKNGEKVKPLGEIVILSNQREPLKRMIEEPAYGCGEVLREGFSNMSPEEFVAMFCKANKCTPETIVSRISFTKLEGGK